MKKINIVFFIVNAIYFNAALGASPDISALWNDPGWKLCLKNYIKYYRHDQPASFNSFINGHCAYMHSNNNEVSPGQCFMRVSGPSDIRNSRGFEVELACGSGVAKTACSNRRNYYTEEFEQAMRVDQKCQGFPDLLAKDLTLAPSRYSEKDVAAIKKSQKTGKYNDLPLSFRYANDNKDPKCRRQVAKIRRIENDPLFETSHEIGAVWSKEVEKADKMGCNL